MWCDVMPGGGLLEALVSACQAGIHSSSGVKGVVGVFVRSFGGGFAGVTRLLCVRAPRSHTRARSFLFVLSDEKRDGCSIFRLDFYVFWQVTHGRRER